MIRFLVLTIGVLFVVGVVLTGAFVFDAYLIHPDDESVTLEIVVEPGESVKQIAQKLEDVGLISSRLFFYTYVWLKDVKTELQAGTFTVKQGMNLRELIALLSRALAEEQQVTIPEGYTLAQIGKTLDQSFEHLSEEEWTQATSSGGILKEASIDLPIVAQGIPEGQTLEGYLFPDTYRFRNEATAETIAETMILTLSRRLVENGVVVPSHLVLSNGMTIHELLTLASIVEREVASFEDRKHVAGIFLSRLQIGMALQADSTVNYITGKQDAAISIEDSKIHSPYNTYQQLGLPPGPICNPGMQAILAVLYPEDSDDLYFLTTEEGKVIYAKTFAEHVANKQLYLK